MPHLLLVLATLAACAGPDVVETDLTPAPEEDRTEDLSPVLQPLVVSTGVPSLAAGEIRGGELVGYGASGVRKVGDPTPVTRADKYHLGSDTKAMTATLLAVLDEQGVLGFDTTFAQAFPTLQVHPDLASVTLEQALRHESGLWSVPPPAAWNPLWQPGDVVAQRARFAEQALTVAPAHPVGSFAYSNTGYMVVGAAMEAATGKPWEQLMQEELFTPLSMEGCGFGGTSEDASTPRQPWGHDGSGSPVPPGPGDDNPPALGPAGTVHCPMPGWGAFLTDVIAGSRGESALLPASAYARLHTPSQSGHALGWVVTTRPWAEGPVLTHAGTNTMNYAVAWVAPGSDLAVFSTTNIAGSDLQLGASATDAAVGALLTR